MARCIVPFRFFLLSLISHKFVVCYAEFLGMATEAAYPYTASDGTCKNVSKPYKSVYYYYLNAEADIPYHVYTYGPVAFCFR